MIQSCFQLIIVCNLFKCCVFFLDLNLSRQTLFWVRVDPRKNAQTFTTMAEAWTPAEP